MPDRQFLRQDYPLTKEDEGLDASIEILRQANDALHMRYDDSLAWERSLNLSTAQESAPVSSIELMEPQAKPKMPHISQKIC